MKYLLPLLFVTLVMSGCGVKTTPPVDEYALASQKNASISSAKQCKNKTIKLLEPFAPYEYTTNELRYIIGEYEEGKFLNSKWSKAPTSAIYNALINAVRNARIFRSVDNYASIAKSDFALEIEINEFKQHFAQDLERSFVVADLTLTLVDKKRFTVVEQKRFTRRIDAKSADAKGGVEALNEALSQIVEEAIDWLSERCGDS